MNRRCSQHVEVNFPSRVLNPFSQHYPDSLKVLVLDNAPAHKAQQVVMPDNGVVLALPPYCPELNPVERLWQDLKARIDVFDVSVRSSLAGLGDHLAEIIRRYTPAQLTSLTGYRYLVEAVNAL